MKYIISIMFVLFCACDSPTAPVVETEMSCTIDQEQWYHSYKDSLGVQQIDVMCLSNGLFGDLFKG